MDSTTHTLIALGLLVVAYYIGRYFGYKTGHQDGIASGVLYLIEYGACTEEDIKRANEKWDREEEDI